MSDFSIMQELAPFTREAGERGILLVTGGERPNAMTIGWITAGVIWGKAIVMVPVRESRYTHELLQDADAFTVYLPKTPNPKAISLCGTKSGRDTDKLAELDLSTARSPHVAAPYITEPGSVIHAKILYRTDMSRDALADEEYNKWYSDDDFHTLYFAEVIALTEN